MTDKERAEAFFQWTCFQGDDLDLSRLVADFAAVRAEAERERDDARAAAKAWVDAFGLACPESVAGKEMLAELAALREVAKAARAMVYSTIDDDSQALAVLVKDALAKVPA